MKPVSVIRAWLGIALLAFGLASMSAHAIELHQAKAEGLVGETTSGYIEAVSGGGGEVAALVRDINAQRRAEYERIAGQNRIPLDQVEALAGKKAIDRTPAGQYVKVGGQWRKK